MVSQTPSALCRRGFETPQVYQEPKTARSRRLVTLSQVAIEALKEHRVQQLEERVAAVGWEDRGLVFPDRIGREQHASNFYRDSWIPLREKAGLAVTVTFHTLRHTMASLALAPGVPVPTVSAMLGHADAAITTRIYAHALPGSQQIAADAMDSVFAVRDLEGVN